LWKRVASLGWRSLLYVGLSILLFMPFISNYVPAVGGLEPFDGERIPLSIFLLVLGQFLFPLVVMLFVENRHLLGSFLRATNVVHRLALALGVAGTLLLTIGLGVGSVPLAYIAIPVGVVAATVSLVREQPVERRFVWLLLFLSMSITVGVELVSVGGDRMNTVFKFFYQVWTMLAICGAASVVWVTERSREWHYRRRDLWMAAMGILVVSMSLFPIMSIPAKLRDRITQETGLTLDGMAFVQYGTVGDVRGGVDLAPDYTAIVWLQDNVEGSPVILEGLGEREYLWGNRISIYTGLPTVVGWRWHQVQQRMRAGGGEVEQRRMDVNECYGTLDEVRAWEILQQYDVRYVYVGPYERLYYDARGLTKFSSLVADGLLHVVYNQDGVRIYEVLP
jgi:YYY domain-containing protein